MQHGGGHPLCCPLLCGSSSSPSWAEPGAAGEASTRPFRCAFPRAVCWVPSLTRCLLQLSTFCYGWCELRCLSFTCEP